MNGHRIEGCKGTWISVGTLSAPDRKMCIDCRGILRLGDEEEPQEPLAAPFEPPAAPLPLVARESDWLGWWILIAVVFASFGAGFLLGRA